MAVVPMIICSVCMDCRNERLILTLVPYTPLYVFCYFS